ncbi:MAG: leucyl aminopeptidase family protein [Pseudomonadota bacterium]
MPPKFASPDAEALPLTLLTPEAYERWKATAGDPERNWAEACRFRARIGEVLPLQGPGGALAGALAGLGDVAARARTRFPVAAARKSLPTGVWVAESAAPDVPVTGEEALGWLLDAYAFRRYKGNDAPEGAELVCPDGLDAARIEAVAAAAWTAQDLINTPAADMGPAALEAAVRALANRHGAALEVTTGDALLSANFPMIHTVGRAAAEDPDRAPRLIDLRWSAPGLPADAPAVTLVGKGVCFDTGGLDLKSAAGMALMKKDMGGAANAIAAAEMVMAASLPVRLRLLVPAVENAVGAAAFRPGDVLTSRKGLTVEVNNTDAEGRLVLADALALADEAAPDLLISMATLTGAARVALGPDLPATFASDPGLGAELDAAGRRVRDPLWQMPFWESYEPLIEPAIADLDNAPSGGMGGAITAALFLRRFTGAARAYAHLDLFAWAREASPGRPKGGACQGARAVFALIEGRCR